MGTLSIAERSAIVISRSSAIWFISCSLLVGGIALSELCVAVCYGSRTLKATRPREQSAGSMGDWVEVVRMPPRAELASSNLHSRGSDLKVRDRCWSCRPGLHRGG
jgi:hypothetical protein